MHRYLTRVCAKLPPIDSDERRQLRQFCNAKSLDEALEGIEGGGAEDADAIDGAMLVA